MISDILSLITSSVTPLSLLNYIQSGYKALESEHEKNISKLLKKISQYVDKISKQKTVNITETISNEIYKFIQKNKLTVAFLYVPITYCLLTTIRQNTNSLELFANALSLAITNFFQDSEIESQLEIANIVETKIKKIITKNTTESDKKINNLLQSYVLYLYYITPELQNSEIQTSLIIADCFKSASKEESFVAIKQLKIQLSSSFPLVKTNLQPYILYLETIFDCPLDRQLLNIINLATTIDLKWISHYVQTGEIINNPAEFIKIQLLGQTVKTFMVQGKNSDAIELASTIIDHHPLIKILGLSLIFSYVTDIDTKLSANEETNIAMLQFIELISKIINIIFVPLQTLLEITYKNKQSSIFKDHLTLFLKTALTNLRSENYHIIKPCFDYWCLGIISLTQELNNQNLAVSLLPHFYQASFAKKGEEEEDRAFGSLLGATAEIMHLLGYIKSLWSQQILSKEILKYMYTKTLQLSKEVQAAAKQRKLIFAIPKKPFTIPNLINYIYKSINSDEIITIISTGVCKNKKQLWHKLTNIQYMILWYLHAYIYPVRFNRTDDFERQGWSIESKSQLIGMLVTEAVTTFNPADIFFMTVTIVSTEALLYEFDMDPLDKLSAETEPFISGCSTYLFQHLIKSYEVKHPKRIQNLSEDYIRNKILYQKNDVNNIFLEALKTAKSDSDTITRLFSQYTFYLYVTTPALQHKSIPTKRIVPTFTMEYIDLDLASTSDKETVHALASLILKLEKLLQTNDFQITLLKIMEHICKSAKIKKPEWFKQSSLLYQNRIERSIFLGIDYNGI